MANAIDIIIKATDDASKVLSNVSKNTEKFSVDIKKSFDSVVKNAAIVSGSIVAVGATVTKMSEDAARGLDLQRGFIRNFGEDVDNNLNILREASQNTISDVDLMATANRAALLGVTSSVEDLARLMTTARLRGKEMGLTTTQAFNDIVTGIGRGSPLILDNLGIKIPDAIKKQMESMDEAQKMQLLLNYAMEDGTEIANQLGGDLQTPSDMFAQIKTRVANFYNELGKKLLPIVIRFVDEAEKFMGGEFATKFVDKVKSIANSLANWISQLKPIVEQYMPEFKKIAEDVGNFIINNLEPILVGLGIALMTVVVPSLVATVSSMAPFLLVAGAITAAIVGLKLAWENNFLGIRDITASVVDWFTGTAVPTIQNYIQQLVDFWSPIWEQVREIFILAWDIIDERIKRAMAIYDILVKPVLTSILNFIKENSESIKNVLINLWEIAKTTVQTAWNVILGIIKTGLLILKGDWSGAWNTIKDTIVKAWDGITSVTGNWWNVMVSSFKIGFNAIIEIVNSAIDKINKAIDDIRAVDVIGNAVPDINIPTIPELAKGTDYFQGGMAIVGERGPELVTMPKGAKVTPNGEFGGATINNTFNNIDMDPSELSRLLMFQLKTL